MRITPLDIRRHTFPRGLSGYAKDEVDAFLKSVADDYESVLRESSQLREQGSRLEERVKELVSNERLLQETLTSAQQISEELKRTAMKEAEVLVGEAELKGERVLEVAHRRAAKLSEDIREMKLLRARLAAAVRATIEAHLGLLESLSEDPPEENPGVVKVAALGRDGDRAPNPVPNPPPNPLPKREAGR